MKTSTIYVSLCVLGVVTLGTLLFSSGNIYSIPTADPFTSSLATPRLHFLLPATHSTPDFCKTLLTTLLHDYSPIIINWGNSEREAKGRLVKIAGVEEYIKNNVSDPNDLILMIDAFDVWVQHPPEVLLAKYAAFPPHVLIGADKKCWPDIPACYHLPCRCLDETVRRVNPFQSLQRANCDGFVQKRRRCIQEVIRDSSQDGESRGIGLLKDEKNDVPWQSTSRW